MVMCSHQSYFAGIADESVQKQCLFHVCNWEHRKGLRVNFRSIERLSLENEVISLFSQASHREIINLWSRNEVLKLIVMNVGETQTMEFLRYLIFMIRMLEECRMSCVTYLEVCLHWTRKEYTNPFRSWPNCTNRWNCTALNNRWAWECQEPSRALSRGLRRRICKRNLG